MDDVNRDSRPEANRGSRTNNIHLAQYTNSETTMLFRVALIAAFFYGLAVIVTIFIIGKFLSGWWLL
jgi:hypothetical protein